MRAGEAGGAAEGQRGASGRAARERAAAELPGRDTRRWVASRKLQVVRAIYQGVLTDAEACQRYGLSAEELESWKRLLSDHGPKALHATRLQQFRQL
ncbi:DUF1153 domain-containing protein [Rhodobacteraceae bacterium KN286]|uniref:DUF1153 domain-containing protein n=1 Tax=Oceanomicrobium pacificus TaxID=2692916 RepID=A0A6B0TMY9_9RHOB|nr:DUF1153 domain-containing protein [Oceanomicrobium pacificus]